MALLREFPSIESLQCAYRRGTLSPVDVVTETLERAEVWQDRLRAIVLTDRSAALAAAHTSERRYRRGTAGPLEGVPVSVKDLMDVAGMPTRYGTEWLREPPIARADARAVHHLRAAGAVIFAKTRLLECAYGIVNPKDGACRNPWDLSRTSGGSSSGAAAATAVGIGYAGLGSDTGGSIRIPAAYCGVVGLKPTYGRVSVQGVLPLSYTCDHVGALARSADDAARVLCALTGAPYAPPPVPEVARLGLLAPWGRDPVTPGVREAFAQFVTQLQAAGYRVEPVEIPELAGADPALMTVIMAEAAAVHRTWLHRQDVRYAEMTLQQLRAGAMIPAVDYVQALRYRTRLIEAVDRALTPVDALLSPACPWVAPTKDPVFGDGDEGSAEGWFSGPFNVTGHPALSLPLPTLVQGLPVGAQLVGRTGGDVPLCALAQSIQTRLGTLRSPAD